MGLVAKSVATHDGCHAHEGRLPVCENRRRTQHAFSECRETLHSAWVVVVLWLRVFPQELNGRVARDLKPRLQYRVLGRIHLRCGGRTAVSPSAWYRVAH